MLEDIMEMLELLDNSEGDIRTSVLTELRQQGRNDDHPKDLL